MSKFVPLKDVTAMRKIAAGMWRAPNDPHTFGLMDVDAEPLLACLDRINAGRETRLTVTHLLIRAIALTIKEHPEANRKIRWGRLLQRKSIDIFVQVALPNGDLSGVTLCGADGLSLDEISQQLVRSAAKIREGDDPAYQKSRDLFRKLPPCLVRPVIALSDFLVNTLHIDLAKQGMPVDLFGSAMVTSVGMSGIDAGFAPFTPVARCPIILVVNAIRKAPWVVGDAVVVRHVLRLTATLDHRIVDGFHGGRLAQTLKTYIEQPDKLLAGPAA